MRSCKLLLLGVGFSTSIAACGSRSPGPEEIGAVRLSVGVAPADALCLRVTAAGSRTVTRRFDLAPGQAAALLVDRLPTGGVSFAAEAFAVACAVLPGALAPRWVSDPVLVTIAADKVADVALLLRRNGRANVSVGFEEEPDAGAPDAAPPGAPDAPPDAGADVIPDAGAPEVPAPPVTAFTRAIVDVEDDAEEAAAGTDLGSSDLEVTSDLQGMRDPQVVGLRFTALPIPRGATITSAHVQFKAKLQTGPNRAETAPEATSFLVKGLASDGPEPFLATAGNLSARPTTAAQVPWTNVPLWPTNDEAGPAQRTPNLAAIVQEIVARPGWASGHALGFVITGTGLRSAHAANQGASLAPVLHVAYTWGEAEVAPPPPAAVDDAFRTTRGAPLAVAAPGLLANDAAGATAAVKVTDAAHGAVAVSPDGAFTYTPAAGYVGEDGFTYAVTTAAGARATATVRLVVSRVAHVVVVSVDGLRPDAVTELGPAAAPNFYRFRTQGAFTDNARTDFNNTITLPNHASMLTGRPVLGPAGHGWVNNDDPLPGAHLHARRGQYVASVFDLAHDRGLRTALFASKSKFVLFDRSYDGTTGAVDRIAPDHGRDKIDVHANFGSYVTMMGEVVQALKTAPPAFTFVHIQEPDGIGHGQGFDPLPGTPYSNVVKSIDGLLGDLFAAIDGTPALSGQTAVVLTTDHGGTEKNHFQANLLACYRIPFYVWGPGVAAGADLYALQGANRADPGTARPDHAAAAQPIRNGDAANLAARLLGLPPVPGSTIGAAAPVAVE